jgi:hypothetical protein
MTTEINNREALENLVGLACQFKGAVEARIGDPRLKAKTIASLDTGEMEKIRELATKIEIGQMAAALAFAGIDGKSFLSIVLENADTMADFAQHVLEKDELVEYLPKGLQNNDAVEQLKNNGAENLAALCEHKLSL